MNKLWRYGAIILGFFACVSVSYANEVYHSVVGYWQTMDPQTHKPDSIVRIWENHQGKFEGKIVKIFLENGHKTSDVCHACTQPHFKNKPILGLKIIWGFVQAGPGFYKNGHILDPVKGDIYKCHMSLKNDGKVLDVHGYIGIPLFGRSVTWYRVHPIG